MLPTTLLADPALIRARAPRIAVPRRVPVARPAVRLPWGRFAAAFLVTAAIASMGVLRAWPPLATVMSGSMAPTISTGDMVVLMRLHGPAHVGDIVAVDVPDEARSRYGYPPRVIHRVVQIAADGTIRTKGDARPESDPFTVPGRAVNVKVVARIPAAGHVLAFLTSGLGLLWLAGGGILLFAMPLLDRQRAIRTRETAAAGTLQDELAAITAELALIRAGQEEQRERDAEQVRETLAALSAQLEELPALIEREVAAAVARALLPAPPVPPVPAPAPPSHGAALVAELVPRGAPRFVPTSWDSKPPPRGRAVVR
jgi:signal peptidase I